MLRNGPACRYQTRARQWARSPRSRCDSLWTAAAYACRSQVLRRFRNQAL